MKKEKFLATLADLGLSEHEAKVYLAALSLGTTTVLKIARFAEIKRTTVYSVAESLKQKGLMSLELKGFKTLYVAADPQQLESVLEQKKEKLRSTLPDLAAMYNLKGGESYLKYYEGLNGIKTVYESLLADIRPHQDYLIFGNADEWLAADKDFFMDFTKRRGELARKYDIKIRMLLQDTPVASEFIKNQDRYFYQAKILPANTKLTTNLVIIPKKIVINQVVPPIMATVIENKSIIQMHREMFEIMWRGNKA